MLPVRKMPDCAQVPGVPLPGAVEKGYSAEESDLETADALAVDYWGTRPVAVCVRLKSI